MARRKSFETDIPLSALHLDIPSYQTDESIPVDSPEVVTEPVEIEVGTEEAGYVEEAAVAVIGPDPETDTEGGHKDIGQWEAFYWRGVPMWRHRRTGKTLSKESLVWKQRNLK